ncbi:FkbM family methyltransferase [Jiella pelagia]|uniref:FkbM family methyltransferase n=1 Tax=Jiella pelagia TaxID=2986949 RepID=A0ABY7BUL6_9HYPH|nr:FkbM family methyltransferase [Jiella pelagia]WAP67002.1 FkbM family methyltransferase [Jiella pelagia]
MAQRPYYYLGGKRGLTRLSSGEPFVVYSAAPDIATWIILNGEWETFVDDVLMAFVRPGDVAVDIGANMGYYSVKLGVRIGEAGRLYAFEPHPELADVLLENVDINDLRRRTTIFRAAAGDTQEAARLIYHPSFPGGGTVRSLRIGPTKGHAMVEIETLRLDDALREVAKIDLIKMDAEGSEPRVLLGARELLDRSPDAVIVTEFWWNAWKDSCDPVSLLRDVANGRRMFHICVDGRLSELRQNDLESRLRAGGTMYLLLVPDTAERSTQLGALLGRNGTTAGRHNGRGFGDALKRSSARWTSRLRAKASGRT